MFAYNPYFFTASIVHWRHLLLTNKNKDIIVDSLKFLVKHKRVKIYAFVIMPNHIHLIWQIQDGHKYSDVQRDFLKFTFQQIKNDILSHHPEIIEKYRTNKKDRKYQIWQYNSLSIELYSEDIFEQKLDYIHQNPVHTKWNLAKTIQEYRYSSAAFYYNESKEFDWLSHYKE